MKKDGETGRVLDIAVSEIKAKGKIVKTRKLEKENAKRPNNSAKGFKKVYIAWKNGYSII